MAKQFAGFTEQQKNVILARNGYKGRPLQNDEALTLIASDPKYNSAYNKAYETAMKLATGVTAVARPMASGGFVFPRKDARGNVTRLNQKDNPEYSESLIEMQAAEVNKLENTFPVPQQDQRRFQEGGTVAYRPPKAGEEAPVVDDPAKTFLNTAQQNYSDSLASQQQARDALAADPSNEDLVTALTAADSKVAQSNEAVSQAQAQFQQTSMPTPSELIESATKDPLSLVTQAGVKETTDEQEAKGTVATGTGQAADTTKAETTTADAAADVAVPVKDEAAKATTTTTSEATKALDGTAATGTISDESKVDAATMSPEELAQLDLETPQITDGAQVEAPDKRKVEEGEMIEGATVDMDRVKEETNFEAATGSPSTEATVKGQLTSLMADFEGGDPPAWAAGAMRAATAAMAARGLGASSMAGQAIIQAAYCTNRRICLR